MKSTTEDKLGDKLGDEEKDTVCLVDPQVHAHVLCYVVCCSMCQQHIISQSFCLVSAPWPVSCHMLPVPQQFS